MVAQRILVANYLKKLSLQQKKYLEISSIKVLWLGQKIFNDVLWCNYGQEMNFDKK